MDYEMEDLLPIVGKLVEKYTAFESTSVTYEKAEQLMGAVFYCIHETEQAGQEALWTEQQMMAQQAYEIGLKIAERKVHEAISMYNELCPHFQSYGCRNLQDTFLQGLPEFFKWYDLKFEPQNTIVTLDYPVLKDLSEYTGIDQIYEFIQCIRLEQQFLSRFDPDYVKCVLRRVNCQYEDMMENICESFFEVFVVHILADKPFMEQNFSENDSRKIKEWLGKGDREEMEKALEDKVSSFLLEYYEECDGLKEYLMGVVKDTLVRLINATDSDMISRYFYVKEV